MIRDLLRHLAQNLLEMRAGQKRVILAAADAGLGVAVLCVLGRAFPDFTPGPVLVLASGLAAGALSVLLGLDRTKLNAFVHDGIPRSLGLAIILAFFIATVPALSGSGNAIGTALWSVPLTFGGIVLSRAALLQIMLMVLAFRHAPVRVFIYGAGKTGQQLAAALRAHDVIVPIGFLDDDLALRNCSVVGLRVHDPAAVAALAARHHIDRVLLAMPSQPGAKLQRLSRRLRAIGLDVHALPSFAQLVGTEPLCDQLAPFDPDDILGRTQLAWDLDRHAGAYRDRTIMVTGAGGSVGAELCRQLLALGPRRLVLYERNELGLYAIHRDLAAEPMAAGIELCPVLGSVTDPRLVASVLGEQGVDVIFHAAAYKHVPLVEANPIAGLTNNVIGTRVVAEAAAFAGIERFILISTDKAVHPTNIMGASKRLAEIVVQDLARRRGRTAFSIVRFGNVMGSSGSVIPLFRDQIMAGGPITLTHDDVTRYFMSLAEAAQLVLFSGAIDKGQGGGQCDVFVLDMGAPIRIRDLATQLVAAAGLTVRDAANPDGDIDIRIVGLRPGEKLHEEPLIAPGIVTTPHPKILRAVEPSVPAHELLSILRALDSALEAGDADLARLVVAAAVGRRDAPDNVAALPQAFRARA